MHDHLLTDEANYYCIVHWTYKECSSIAWSLYSLSGDIASYNNIILLLQIQQLSKMEGQTYYDEATLKKTS